MGKVLGRWVRRLASLEAVSAGLALTQDVRTFSDITVLQRSFAWWLVAVNMHLKLSRGYSEPGRLP